jgi:hypothetical protein
MSDTTVERLIAMVEANTKSYENAMKRLPGFTDDAMNRVDKSFARPRRNADAFSKSIDNARMRVGAAGGSLGQLSFQLNDIASGLLMGQSPFQIMAQQGGQVFQIWQLNRNIFRDVKEAAVSGATRLATALGPFGTIGLAVGVAGAAAAYFYSVINDNASNVNADLEQHKKIIDQVKDAFSGARTEAAKFYKDSMTVLKALNAISTVHLQADLASAVKKSAAVIPGVTVPNFPAIGGRSLNPMEGVATPFPSQAMTPFIDLMRKHNVAVEQGTNDIKEYRDAISSVILAHKDDRAVVDFGKGLLDSSDAANDLTNKLRENEAIQKILAGTASKTDQQIVGIAGSTKAASTAFPELTKRIQDQITELQFEAQHAGEAGFQVEGLKKQHELLRAALKSGVPDTVTARNAIKALADAYSDAKQNAAAAKLQADALFERQQLGRTDAEASVQAALWGAGIDPASAIGAQTAAELRLNAALTETKSLATDALSTLEDDFMRGADGATILRDELGLLTKEALKLANQSIISGLFGGAGGLGGAGGGLLSGIGHLFGFATGGSFTVGGTGGTDSKVVAFRATPGEVVNVRKGGGDGGSSGISIVMPVSIDARGADQAAVVRIGQGLQQLQRTLPTQISAVVTKKQTRGVRA